MADNMTTTIASYPINDQLEVNEVATPEPNPAYGECIRSPTPQDTGKFRTNLKDQFYTDEHVARSCIRLIIDLVPCTSGYLWVEPSAGSGSFLHNVPATYEKVGLDLDPKATDIQEQDYLEWAPPVIDNGMIVFGNPPFGRQSSLVKAFIAKSCEFAQIIAFILPKSFTKPSMFNAFHKRFHLILSHELEKNSFIRNGAKYDAPCVFQIWQKRDVDRPVGVRTGPVGFRYVKSVELYHIALRRVGGLAGKCFTRNNRKQTISIESHYFLQLDDSVVSEADAIVDAVNAHSFPSNTLGPRSIAKFEVNVVLNAVIRAIATPLADVA